jgi:hypothetical protein
LRDRDAIYGDTFQRRVAGMGIGERRASTVCNEGGAFKVSADAILANDS